MSNTHSLSTMFYETVESKEINVAYAGERIGELHSMTEGFLSVCRAGLEGDFACAESGILLVFIATLEDMKRRLSEIYPMESGEAVIREATTRKPGK